EGARTVDDVISRRTRLAFEAPEHGVHLAEEVANLIAPILGWSAKDKKQSVSEYEELVDRETAALDELLDINS
ncbi:MAG: glycerol-3-phosphate dehydrogenase, partial [Actinobacteria bacterium]|nr:glycerol-3-phosphate dehydrogenase [Actinomycetota bacterium]